MKTLKLKLKVCIYVVGFVIHCGMFTTEKTTIFLGNHVAKIILEDNQLISNRRSILPLSRSTSWQDFSGLHSKKKYIPNVKVHIVTNGKLLFIGCRLT